MDEPFSQGHEKGVKIPVIPIEKLGETIELTSVEENPILKALREIEERKRNEENNDKSL